MPYRWCPRCGKLFYCVAKQPATCTACAKVPKKPKKRVEYLKQLEAKKDAINKRLEENVYTRQHISL